MTRAGAGDAEGPSAPTPPAAPALDLTGPEADDLLRSATELAFEMAQTGVRLQPPLEVPSRLRPVLAHAKVTKAALSTVRRVVDDDEGFREQVAKGAQMPGAEATVGRAGVLWLCRPDGWEAELDGLVLEARAAAAARAEDAEERTAQRRLRHAEEARDRAERAVEDARRASEAARADLQEERRLRRAADDAAERVGRHARSLEEQLAAARRAVEAAAARLALRSDSESSARAAHASAEAELGDLRAEVAGLRAALTDRLAAAAATEAAPGDAAPRRAGPAPAPPVDADRHRLGEAVAAASAAAAALGEALAQAAAALEPAAASERGEARPAGASAPGLPRRPATPPRWARPRRRPGLRDPAPLPPLVHDDSAEAAEHLVSLPGVALLVDGYNATLSTWPGLPLPEQRLRLVDALAELAARTGARPEVVFDGAEVAVDRPAWGTVRSLVRVSFTAHDVEADDVLIARAAELPVPVVVASDDRRVRDGARAAGANVLGIEQLLAALRRQGPG